MPIVTVQFDTDTHKVVPFEPTDMMQDCGSIAMMDRADEINPTEIACDVAWQVYNVMIAAAPEVQPVTLEETPPEVSPEDAQKALDDLEKVEAYKIGSGLMPYDFMFNIGGHGHIETIRRALLCLSNSHEFDRQTDLTVQNEWQPINTAPKNGTSIWAYQDQNHHQCIMHWIEGDGYSLWVYTDEVLTDVEPSPKQPTHWMPLPNAPRPAFPT